MRFGDLLSDAAYLTEQTAEMHEDLEGIGAYALRRLNPSARTSVDDLSDTAERMQMRLQKSDNLLRMLEKHQSDISELRLDTEQEIIKLNADRLRMESPDEIKRIDEQIRVLQEQRDKLEWMQKSSGEMTEQFQERVDRTRQIRQSVTGHRSQILQRAARKRAIAKGIVAAPRKYISGKAKRAGKGILRKANPLDKNINKNSTADHGMESLRLAYRTGKKTVQTAKTTAKTAKTTVKAVKKAPRVIVNTTKRTVNAVRTTVRVTSAILTHVVAALINPVTWILLFFGVVIYVILSIVVILMGGASTQDATQAISYTQQVGIDDADMDDAREYYRIACERNKGNFSALINGLYYNTSDLRRSDLVYMERNADGTIRQYTRGFATPTWKSSLSNAWMISVPEQQAIAIAYVYLQAQENNSHGTQQQIYQVEYTQDVFNQIVDAAVRWSDTTYPHQQCAQNNCSVHHDTRPNPAYQTAQTDYNNCVARRDDFNAMVVPRANDYARILNQYNNAPPPAQSAMQGALDNAWAMLVQAFRNWESVFGYTGWAINEDIGYNGSAWLQQFVDSAYQTLQNTEPTITDTYYTCDHQHTLHSIGLFTYNKETVMTALGFTDADKEWENLIELGMNLDLRGGT